MKGYAQDIYWLGGVAYSCSRQYYRDYHRKEETDREVELVARSACFRPIIAPEPWTDEFGPSRDEWVFIPINGIRG